MKTYYSHIKYKFIIIVYVAFVWFCYWLGLTNVVYKLYSMLYYAYVFMCEYTDVYQYSEVYLCCNSLRKIENRTVPVLLYIHRQIPTKYIC